MTTRNTAAIAITQLCHTKSLLAFTLYGQTGGGNQFQQVSGFAYFSVVGTFVLPPFFLFCLVPPLNKSNTSNERSSERVCCIYIEYRHGWVCAHERCRMVLTYHRSPVKRLANGNWGLLIADWNGEWEIFQKWREVSDMNWPVCGFAHVSFIEVRGNFLSLTETINLD